MTLAEYKEIEKNDFKGFANYINVIPKGYEVWNIGSRNITPGILPVCKTGCNEKKYTVEDILLLKTEYASAILDCPAAYTPEYLLKAITKPKKSLAAYYSRRHDEMIKTLEYMNSLNWEK